MLLELRKIVEEEYLPVLSRHFDNFWQLTGDSNSCLVRHLKAALYGVLFTIFGLIVLSFDNVQPKPGTTVIRDKIFGIEQRYFLVYFNGLLLYVCWIFIMENDLPTT